MGDQEREKDEWHNKMEMSKHKNVMMSSSRDIDQIKKKFIYFLDDLKLFELRFARTISS